MNWITLSTCPSSEQALYLQQAHKIQRINEAVCRLADQLINWCERIRDKSC